MKGLIKGTTLVSLAVASTPGFAELTSLDDTKLKNITGRAGLTIDIETKQNIAEFAYRDGGFIILQNYGFKASTSAEEVAFAGSNDYLDNLRLNVDISGPSEDLGYAFSTYIEMANHHADNSNVTPEMLAAAGLSGPNAVDETTSLMIDEKKAYNDGDLVVHVTPTDTWQKGGGIYAYENGVGDDGTGNFNADLSTLTYDAFRDIANRAIDFNLYWEVVGVAASDYDIGSGALETYVNTTTGAVNGTDHSSGLDATTDTTVYLSGISLNGYLGPVDFILQNNGNGFGADGSGHLGAAGTGNADSKVHLEAFFDITDLDIYIDIAGLQLSDISIHNRRGDLGSMNRNADDTGFTSSFGFAHAYRDIYSVKDTVLNPNLYTDPSTQWVDGIGHDVKFKGEYDIGKISFGDTETSVGSIYVTDVNLERNWVISAH